MTASRKISLDAVWNFYRVSVMDALDSVCLEHRFGEGLAERCECPYGEQDAVRIIEAMELNTFESALNMFEEFLSNISLFESSKDKDFSQTARALDTAALTFSAIDANHDLLMTRDELKAYLASGNGNESLIWLLSKFSALQRLCFFLNAITRDELESARDFFHGLSYLKNNFEKFADPQRSDEVGSLSQKRIREFLRENRNLEIHDARGLDGLVYYVERVNKLVSKERSAEIANKVDSYFDKRTA